MTSEQVTAVNSALTTTGQEIFGTFTSVLPAVGSIVAIGFAIGLVSYWIKKVGSKKN